MKFIRKHVNESINLPSKNQKKITSDDITRANTTYIKNKAKQEVIDGLNKALAECSADDINPYILNEYLMFPRFVIDDKTYDYSPAIIDTEYRPNSETSKSGVVTIALFCTPSSIEPADINSSNTDAITISIKRTLQFIINLNQILNDIIKNSSAVSDININIVPAYADISKYDRFIKDEDYSSRLPIFMFQMPHSYYYIDNAIDVLDAYAKNPCTIKSIKFTTDLLNYVNNLEKRCQKNGADIMQFISRCSNQFDTDFTLCMDHIGYWSETENCFIQLCNASQYANRSINNVAIFGNLTSFIFEQANKQKILALAKNPNTFFIDIYANDVYNMLKTNKIYAENSKNLMISVVMYLLCITQELHVDCDGRHVYYKPLDSSFYLKRNDGTYFNINDVENEFMNIIAKSKLTSYKSVGKIVARYKEDMLHILTTHAIEIHSR